jgi:asparagine synthase (glutamine-hydrolysing)
LALQRYVPQDILYRPKQGFSVPLAVWFRGPLRGRLTQTLRGSPQDESGLFDRRVVERLIDQHLSSAFDHSAPLWLLLVFDAFLRREGGS